MASTSRTGRPRTISWLGGLESAPFTGRKSADRENHCEIWLSQPDFVSTDVGLCADAMGRAARPWQHRRYSTATDGAPPMSQHCHFDASRSLTALEQDSTIIAVIEMSQTKWLVAALVPGVERQPLKKFDAHEETLLKLLLASLAPRSRPGRAQHQTYRRRL